MLTGYPPATPFTVLNPRPGAILHVMFPVVSRMTLDI